MDICNIELRNRENIATVDCRNIDDILSFVITNDIVDDSYPWENTRDGLFFVACQKHVAAAAGIH